MDRDEAVARIRKALRQRTGRTWSVTGGRGTAWGWITIDAPPARRTMHSRLKPMARSTSPTDYEMVDTGEPGGYMTPEDQKILGDALGLTDRAHHQGVSIPASSAYYEEYVARAEGRTPERYGEQYWD